MDFLTIRVVPSKGGMTVYPDFKVCDSKDLMVKGSKFYAIWDEEAGLWSTNAYDAQRLIDKELDNYVKNNRFDSKVKVKYLASFSSQMWTTFLKYVNGLSDNYKLLDRTITFKDSTVKKSDYISRKLMYSLEDKPTPAYDELVSSLYSPEEREKFEWIIGSIIAGDSRKIQKFLVFYGGVGTGKSTIINIIQKLFDGYYNAFNAKALGNSNSEFAVEPFRLNPIVAIQHDGDLSHIEDNTRLNSITSHEPITINIKHKSVYTDTITSMCIMGTNKPVKITDAQSGIIRRLIDVSPKGEKIPVKRYEELYSQIDFELGGIANRCLNVYKKLGRSYYKDYKPISMMKKTDVFFNFMQECYNEYSDLDEVTLKKAWEDYKFYCSSTSIKYDMPQYKFREELREYFETFEDYAKDKDGNWVRSIFKGFKKEKIYKQQDTEPEKKESKKESTWCKFNCTKSLLDYMLLDCPAQYAKEDGTPVTTWGLNNYILKDIDTRELHYVKPPLNHIVIDFDLKNEKGEKDFKLNQEAASKWPITYAELSKSGTGIHLHYIYLGDPEQLASIYDTNIEVKVFKGRSALRRKLTKCNNIPVASISSGLPLIKKVEKVVDFKTLENEKALDTYIRKCLNKEYSPHATKPMIDYIYDALEKAYNNGMKYDMSKWYSDVMYFAQNSTHNATYCVNKVVKMKWVCKDLEKKDEPTTTEINKQYEDQRIIFFDIEVFPNLFLVCWKFDGSNKKNYLINPSVDEVKRLLKMKLVGFNCRRYDNHIMYAAACGFTVKELYLLSKKIIKEQKGFMKMAYSLSYADIYDFSTIKQSLKKFEIDLGMHHQELPLDWNQDVPDDKIELVKEYCGNDVDATEATFHSRIEDFNARCIIAELSGMSPNDTTRVCAEQFIFGDDYNPQEKFVYTKLAEQFPSYTFNNGVSTYLDEVVGEGGYVYAEPGAYGIIICLDVASMHPHSMIELNIFGPYTSRLKELVDARIAVKHEDKVAAKKLLDGILIPYMTDTDSCKKLAYALKIIINSIYGLTCASFANRFRDPRNIDNIVAKRGALFMCTLKHKVQEMGYKVVHIKTDSIKISDPDDKVIKFIKEFGKEYGYTFEVEEEFERLLLVNNAVYVGKTKEGEWTATGAEFIHPYVFKALFSKEAIKFEDLCETKQVQTEIYLDFNEENPEKHRYHFVGKVGSFVPVSENCGGGLLMRKVKADDQISVDVWLDEEDVTYTKEMQFLNDHNEYEMKKTKVNKFAAVTGTKGYRWKEAEIVKRNKLESQIDMNYYITLAEEAKKHISEFCDYDLFVSEDAYIANNQVYSNNKLNEDLPWDNN